MQPLALRQSPPNLSVLCYACQYHSAFPAAPQWHCSLPSDLTLFICYSVLLMVHRLSSMTVMSPIHSHFTLVMYSTMSVTLALCLMMVLQILSFHRFTKQKQKRNWQKTERKTIQSRSSKKAEIPEGCRFPTTEIWNQPFGELALSLIVFCFVLFVCFVFVVVVVVFVFVFCWGFFFLGGGGGGEG